MAVEKRIVVGASGASGMPLLIKCLEILQDNEEYRSLLVMSRSAKLTLEQETDWSVSQVEALADEVLDRQSAAACGGCDDQGETPACTGSAGDTDE